MTDAALRILDLDLDLFVHEVAIWRNSNDERLDPEDYPPWTVDSALAFLTERCGMRDRLPGFVVEHHGELFGKWRDAIAAGRLRAPFHVTHADAHADLGMGDSGYFYLMTSLLYKRPEDRLFPDGGEYSPTHGVGDGNYLAFAIACRWVHDLVYVSSTGDRGDVLPHLMEGFDQRAAHIRLAAIPVVSDLRENYVTPQNLRPDRFEPRVPFTSVACDAFQADEPFDIVCLARSPGFTPAGCDEIFDEIRRRFIDESAFAGIMPAQRPLRADWW
jgi:hypothetical protein